MRRLAVGIFLHVAAYTTFISAAYAAACEDKPRITGLIDGDTPGTDGLPKVVQVYFPCPVDASADKYRLSLIPANSSAAPGGTVALAGLSQRFKDKGGFIYASPERLVFEDYMGFSPDFVQAKFHPTGTDAMQLMKGKEVIDMYGSRLAAPMGKWDYTNGSALRIFGTEPDSHGGSVGDWIIRKGYAKNGASVPEVNATLVEYQSCKNYPCPGDRRKLGDRKCAEKVCSKADCETCCEQMACISTHQRVFEAEQRALLSLPPSRVAAAVDGPPMASAFGSQLGSAKPQTTPRPVASVRDMSLPWLQDGQRGNAPTLSSPGGLGARLAPVLHSTATASPTLDPGGLVRGDVPPWESHTAAATPTPAGRDRGAAPRKGSGLRMGYLVTLAAFLPILLLAALGVHLQQNKPSRNAGKGWKGDNAVRTQSSLARNFIRLEDPENDLQEDPEVLPADQRRQFCL